MLKNNALIKEKIPETSFGRLSYRFTLARWFFNFGWAWIVGFILTWVNTITVVYYLIPQVKASLPFSSFIIYGSLALIALSTFLGWLLIKIFRVQSIETKIGTDINPYSHTWLTRKEIALWRLLLSTAEQVKELGEKSKRIGKDKQKLFEKRIEKFREYLTNSKKHELDLLGKSDGFADVEDLT